MAIEVGKRYRIVKHGAGLVGGKAGKIVKELPAEDGPEAERWFLIRLDDFSHVGLPESYFEEGDVDRCRKCGLTTDTIESTHLCAVCYSDSPEGRADARKCAVTLGEEESEGG